MAEKHSSKDILKCPACLKIYTELKTLPCQESFCLNCLEGWLKKKEDELECQNCHEVHQLNENKLQDLPSKVAVKKVKKREKILIQCFCNTDYADFYCKECSKYMCKECKKYHDLFPALQNHSPQELEVLEESSHQTLCALHERELEFFCKTCKIPICTRCKDENHRDDDEQHEPITAADAFDEFKEKAFVLMAKANAYMQKLREGIQKCTTNVSRLGDSKIDLKEDINSTVEDIVKLVRETGKKLEKKLDMICDLKKGVNNAQIDELNAMTLAVKEKQGVISELINDSAGALQSGIEVIDQLKKVLDDVPETEPRDDGNVFYRVNKFHVFDVLKEKGIGVVVEKMDANDFKITCPPSLSQQKLCQIKIVKKVKYEVDMSMLNASWMYYDDYYDKKCIEYQKVKQVDEGEYVVEVPSDIGTFQIPTLDIKFGEASIKGSPLQVSVLTCAESENKISLPLNDCDVDCINNLLISKNGYFFVAGTNFSIGKFQSRSGVYVSEITLSDGGKCCGMWELNNNDFVLCDSRNQKVIIYKPDGQMQKYWSAGKSKPLNMDVNESLNLVYITQSGCVNVFDMMSGDKVMTIGTKGSLEGQLMNPSSVAVTKDGKIIVADTDNSRVQLFDNDGAFKNIFIGKGSDDGMVIRPSKIIIDNDDIIIASEGKVQLFDDNGKFIKRIYGVDNNNNNYVISIFSHNPRRLAVAELNSKAIDIINY